MSGFSIRRRPFDKKVQCRSFGTGAAGRIGGDFAIEKGIYLVGIPVNEVTGITECLVGKRAIRELIRVVV